MQEFLKWLFAKKEMEELCRWRISWEQYRRWLGEFPEVRMALDNLRAEVDGQQLDACTPPGKKGPWTVSGLRDRLRSLAAEQK